MTRRILTIIVAIVLAVVGTGAVLAYVNQANQRAVAGQRAVTVLVAAQQIPAGTSAAGALRDGLLVKQRVPAKSVAGTDYVSAITPSLGALVVSSDLPSGELLLRPMLVTSVTSTSGIAIPAGDVAVTIALCVPQAVAGYVGPGSQVAVFDTTGSGSGGCSSGGGTSTGTGTSTSTTKAPTAPKVNTKIVLPKVTVLAIGQASAAPAGSTATSTAFSQSSTATSSDSTGSVLVTLAVDQSDAERVISLAESGLPYLALLGQSPTPATGPDHGTISLFPPSK